MPHVSSKKREKKRYLGFSHSPSLKLRMEGMEGMAMQRERKRKRRQAENRVAGVLKRVMPSAGEQLAGALARRAI